MLGYTLFISLCSMPCATNFVWHNISFANRLYFISVFIHINELNLAILTLWNYMKFANATLRKELKMAYSFSATQYK